MKHKLFWLIIFSAIALRLVYYHQIKDDFLFKTPILDAKYYNDWALEIVKGDILGAKRGVFMMSPGYSYYLAGVYKAFGTNVTYAVFSQFALGLLTGLLIFLIGKRTFSGAAGLAGMAVFLFYGPELFYESVLVKTTLINFTNTLSLLLLVSGAGLEGLLAGVLLGFSAHLRPNVLLFAPFALGWLLWNKKNAKAALFTAGIFLVLLPVGLRNYKVGKEFVMTTAHGGMNFFTGNSQFCRGPYTPMPFARTDPEVEQADFLTEACRISGKTLTPKESSDFWYAESFKYIRRYPGRWFDTVERKALIFFNVYEPPINLDYYFFKSVYGSALSLPLFDFGVLLPLAALGMLFSPFSFSLLAYGAVYFISGVIFFVVSEYRFPVVPLFCVYAGAFAVYLSGVYRRKGVSFKLLSLCAVSALLIYLANYDIYSSVFGFVNYKRSNLANSYFGMGATYEEKGMENEAVNSYQAALKIMPQAGPLVNLAMIREKHGDYDGAQQLYMQAIKVNPGSVEALNDLGGVFYRKKDFKSAEACFDQALLLNPSFDQARKNLELTRKAEK